ncbi:unnamed protein product [Acanthoscelides obtectus]|uniref:Kinetochore protein Nuf2 N-terminal domain-containing protein n=1 Tax=Acanthoscelides obtectus TaxID=200917 RepID=A0A9P0LJF6_ACAOB|nr:unnamed protein product [Acanthoscelides obtectus]CAK1636152.1 hypothetical protein AOBTE_LOCUS9763 [Acanthoscelides obtectus]
MFSEEDTVIEQIRLNFPGFTITKDALLRPTPDGVKRFYRRFLDEYLEQTVLASAITDSNISVIPEDAEEEVLFSEISKIVSNHIKFMLRDIYQPSHVRTVKFFMVCTHILSFLKSMAEQFKQLNDNAVEMKIETIHYVKEHENILNLVSDNAKKITLQEESKAALQIELKEKKAALEQVEEKRRIAVQDCLETRKIIEQTKSRMTNDQFEIDRLEKLHQKLQSMYVSEGEYHSIKHQINTLEEKLRAIEEEENELPDMLSVEEDELENHRKCKRKIPEPESFVEQVTHLMQIKDELKNVLEEVESLKKQLQLVQIQCDWDNNSLVGICTKCQSLKKECEAMTKLCCQSEQNLLKSIEKMQKSVSGKERDLQSNIAQLTEETLTRETDIKKMLEFSKEASVKIGMAEQHVCTRFFEMLVRISDELRRLTNTARSGGS